MTDDESKTVRWGDIDTVILLVDAASHVSTPEERERIYVDATAHAAETMHGMTFGLNSGLTPVPRTQPKSAWKLEGAFVRRRDYEPRG